MNTHTGTLHTGGSANDDRRSAAGEIAEPFIRKLTRIESNERDERPDGVLK
jgi:hypothetical protein